MAARVRHLGPMDRVFALHQPRFAFTVTFYSCPQVALSLALLVLILETIALRTENPDYD